MGEAFFCDAWLFIALTDRHDSHHRQASRLAQRLRSQVVVTHAIFHEVLAFFSEEGAHMRAQALGTVLDAMRWADVITPDRPLFLAALDRYASRPDKEYSLTDCLSMVVMERLGVSHVLTNDHHFRQEGFTVVSE